MADRRDLPDLKVLVVDDSVAVRRAIGDALEHEPGFTLCGAAPNGVLALELVERSRPDVIVLDLEMPVLDGLDFLTRLRPQHPRLPVLVFSGTVGHANEATLEALWRGASDYLLKPRDANPEHMDAFLRAELLPRLRALARVQPAPATPGSSPRAALPPAARAVPAAGPRAASPASAGAAPRPAPPARDPAPRMIVVGASTGGPRALAAALGELPRDYAIPIAIVQHMPTEMAEFFAGGLSANCRMRVAIAGHGQAVEPGVLWVAPGGAHLTIASDGTRLRFQLDHGPEQNGCRPSVDPLFASAAHGFGAATLAIVLTGMGNDGVEGARAVHAARGRVLVQDESSSVVWGMPGAVVRAGLANAVVPLSLIGGELIALGSRGRLESPGSGPTAEAA